MLLEKEVKRTLMRRFPEIKLSYNKNIHRKVYADFYQIIPKGQKALLWFTYIHKKNVCLLLKLDYKGNIKDIEKYSLCFEDNLSYGTVMYGTFIRMNDHNIYCIEDIYYYKGKNVERKPPFEKLSIYQKLFENELSQKVYTSRFIKPVLAYMTKDYNSIHTTIENLPYKVYGIKYIRNKFTVGVEKVKIEIKREAIFSITATINADIYNLYIVDDETNSKIYYDIAYIASYAKSVFMNNLFRNIKENKNLDLLEESDDEEEFENTNQDKFVDLEKEMKMKCVYNNKFKKWEPLCCIDDGDIASIKDIKYIQNKV